MNGTGAIPDFENSTRTSWYEEQKLITNVVIDEGVTRIGPYAFVGGKMERVDIPSNVKIVGARAFDQCYKLDTVSIKDVAAWCTIDFCGIYANPLWHARSLYLNDTLITDLIIPFGVVSISKYAFYACKSLTSIEIPNSVTIIGDQVFDGCHSLKSVTCCATTLPELGNSVWGTVNC